MAFSNEMEKLAARAKLAEEHVAAAGDKARADLQREVDTAREQQTDMRTSVRGHLAAIRERIDDKKAEHDLAQAQRDADEAQYDALYAIDYAYGAIEEAESLVLDAELARMDADELEAGAPTTT